MGGDEAGVLAAGGVGGRRVAIGLPLGIGDADGEDTEHHEGEVEEAHDDHGVGDGGAAVVARGAEVGHELVGEGAANHGSSTEAHDGEAGGEAGAVGEPLDEGGDGGDVAEAEANAADGSVAEVDEPELVGLDAGGGDEEARAEAAGGVEHGAAGAGFFQPGAEDGGGEAEEGDGYGEDVADVLIQVGGIDGAGEGLDEGVFEDREGVDLADGEMDGEGGRWDEPAVVVDGGYGSIAVEETHAGLDAPSCSVRAVADGGRQMGSVAAGDGFVYVTDGDEGGLVAKQGEVRIHWGEDTGVSPLPDRRASLAQGRSRGRLRQRRVLRVAEGLGGSVGF